MASNQSLSELTRNFYENGGAASPSATAKALAGNGNIAALLAAPQQVGAAGPHRIFTYNLYNPSAAVAFVQFFNKVAAPTVGTDAPLDWIAIPPGGVVDGAWAVSPAFDLGLWVAATTTPTGAAAPASALAISLGFI